MHHHLIAIPDTGYTNVVGISDAGDVLRTCLANDVDIVICGHKHRPWIWDLRYNENSLCRHSLLLEI